MWVPFRAELDLVISFYSLATLLNYHICNAVTVFFSQVLCSDPVVPVRSAAAEEPESSGEDVKCSNASVLCVD